jgi:Uma2 family endonuclease
MPDVLVHPAAVRTPDVRGSDVLLLIEVADTSLNYDINAKVPLYAAHGVREYWVINAVTLTTKVHREPSGSAYRPVAEVRSDLQLRPSLVPAFAISLSALEL